MLPDHLIPRGSLKPRSRNEARNTAFGLFTLSSTSYSSLIPLGWIHFLLCHNLEGSKPKSGRVPFTYA